MKPIEFATGRQNCLNLKGISYGNMLTGRPPVNIDGSNGSSRIAPVKGRGTANAQRAPLAFFSSSFTSIHVDKEKDFFLVPGFFGGCESYSLRVRFAEKFSQQLRK